MSTCLVLHGRLFKDTYFIRIFELEANDSPKNTVVRVINNLISIF